MLEVEKDFPSTTIVDKGVGSEVEWKGWSGNFGDLLVLGV